MSFFRIVFICLISYFVIASSQLRAKNPDSNVNSLSANNSDNHIYGDANYYIYGRGLKTTQDLDVNNRTRAYLKSRYDLRYYNPNYGERYNPYLMSLYSFVLPGEGQMMIGEAARGLIMTSIFLISPLTITIVGALASDKHPTFFTYSIVAAYASMLTMIWSSIDAYIWTKYINMYNVDLEHNASLQSCLSSIKIEPFVNYLNKDYASQSQYLEVGSNSIKNLCLGLSLSLKF